MALVPHRLLAPPGSSGSGPARSQWADGDDADNLNGHVTGWVGVDGSPGYISVSIPAHRWHNNAGAILRGLDNLPLSLVMLLWIAIGTAIPGLLVIFDVHDPAASAWSERGELSALSESSKLVSVSIQLIGGDIASDLSRGSLYVAFRL